MPEETRMDPATARATALTLDTPLYITVTVTPDGRGLVYCYAASPDHTLLAVLQAASPDHTLLAVLQAAALYLDVRVPLPAPDPLAALERQIAAVQQEAPAAARYDGPVPRWARPHGREN